MNPQEETLRRQAVKDVYFGSTTWHEKVDKMSPKQVTALYLKFKAEGRIR